MHIGFLSAAKVLSAALSRSLSGEPGNPGGLFKDGGQETMFEEVMKHFEREALVSVMARVALEGASTSQWGDEVFAAHRQRQYPGELLFSTVVELMTLVSLGLNPTLYAAATKAQHLPASLAAL
ncbi:hypothetical protein [Paraburkholderia solitsugae]